MRFLRAIFARTPELDLEFRDGVRFRASAGSASEDASPA
jgi:hypothetical protein